MDEENKKPDIISYYEHEAEIARSEVNVERFEKNSKRWMIACIIVFVALVLTNAAWIIHESLYQDVYSATQTVTQEAGDSGGTNNFSVGDFYGGSDGKADSKANNN